MTLPVSTQSYTQAYGSASNLVFITHLDQRAPSANDINYAVTKRWVNTLTGKEYILIGFTTTASVTQAIWINLTNGTLSGVDTLTGNSGGAITPDGSSNINVLGDSTTINISGSSHTLTANVILPSTSDVVLIGETTSISYVPNGAEGLVLTSHTSGPPTFESSSSGLTLNPFGSAPNAEGALLSGGVLTLEPASEMFPGGITASGTQGIGGIKSFVESPILPLTGLLVGNGATQVTANLITDNAGLIGGNSNTIISVPLNNGQFIIGATSGTPSAGTITAGSGIIVTPSPGGITVASTATGFVWLSESSNFSALASHGYVVSSTATATLPSSPSLGDTISFYSAVSNALTIKAAGSDLIAIGSSVSTAGGTCKNTINGDAITLVCIYTAGPNGWSTINSPQGVWVLA